MEPLGYHAWALGINPKIPNCLKTMTIASYAPATFLSSWRKATTHLVVYNTYETTQNYACPRTIRKS